MKQRYRIVAFITVAFLFILSCAALITVTIAKYVAEKDAPWGDDQDIDFTVDNVYEVTNQDELFSALNNGYPFIRLSRNINNPLIITDDAKNLHQDLILDLNGITIQRNGHAPILNILPGVRLTVTDTSQEQTGGLYNPVGSVFNIAGGTLTVANGVFESGPRYSEYYSYNNEVLDNSVGSETKRTNISGAADVDYYMKNAKGEFEHSTRTAAIIQSYPTRTNEIIYNHGNLYFDTPVERVGDKRLDHTISADTYCYYYTHDSASYLSSVPTDADFYYSYYVKTATNTYHAATLTKEEEESKAYTKVSIYGYENLIEGAASKINQSDYYAAVKMQEGMGKLDVQAGKFFCYFGVDTTAAVNAMGGSITVKTGEFSSRIPNATSTTTNSVSQKQEDYLAFDDHDYFNSFKWANESCTGGAQARKGESYCILNSGNASVNILKGKFYSSNNNTISMNGGELTASGSFTKKNTIELTERDMDESVKYAVVYMRNGALNISDVDFNVYGDYTTCVYINAGTIDIANSVCNVEGEYTNGIYSLVAGKNFTVTDTNFSMTGGDSLMGIYAENGEVSLRSNSKSTFNLTGADSKAVYAAAGSTIKSEGYVYTLSGSGSQGVYSTGGAVAVDGGSMKLENASSTGIYSTGGEVKVSGVDFRLDGENSMGIYSTGGNVTAVNSTITISSNVNGFGVHVSNSAAAPTVELSGVTIHAGDNTVNANKGMGTVEATVGVFLQSNGNGAIKLMNGTSIYSNEVGIAVNSGNVTWLDGGELAAYNGSAIAVKTGNITFGSQTDTDSEFVVTSNINGEKDTKGHNSSTSNSYNLSIVGDAYNNVHGVYIVGGAFICHGRLHYTFDGLCNDDQANHSRYDPLGNETRSFAVYVKAADTATEDAVNFSAVQGSIEVTTGGGVWVADGNVMLGDTIDETRNNTTLSVITKGGTDSNTGMYENWNGGGGNWNYKVTKSGGPALKVTGGSLYVGYGSYIAARGKALLVNNGNVKVKKGNFVGGALPDVKDEIEQDDTKGNSYDPGEMSGLACYYGLFVSGQGNVSIDDGNFLGQNGGAFFYGSDNSNACVTEVGKGKFLSVKTANGDLRGLCGICVMGNADLTMNDVSINAVNAAISVEGNEAVSTDNSQAHIKITGGEYITNYSAVIYNYGSAGKHATWNIMGGHFKTSSGKIFQTAWGSYAPSTWREVLGDGYAAYAASTGTGTGDNSERDISEESTSASYIDVYVRAKAA